MALPAVGGWGHYRSVRKRQINRKRSERLEQALHQKDVQMSSKKKRCSRPQVIGEMQIQTRGAYNLYASTRTLN